MKKTLAVLSLALLFTIGTVSLNGCAKKKDTDSNPSESTNTFLPRLKTN